MSTGNPYCRIWIHANSLGEYGVVLSIIHQLKQNSKCRIVLTYSSLVGYETIEKNHPNVDDFFFLPCDTKYSAQTFLEIVNPQKAIFIVSAHHFNYLFELRSRKIPTYLISADIKNSAFLYKWCASTFREALLTFKHFTVINARHKSYLNSLGFGNVTVTGDPLFNNAIAIANDSYTNPIIERFVGDKDVFIASDIFDKTDIKLVCGLANRNKNIKFILIPHSISEESLTELKFSLEGFALNYSEYTATADLPNVQVLIIDYLGAIPLLYRYAKWGYIGNGFSPHLNSLIEASVYGVPITFRSQTKRRATPNELETLSLGLVVHNAKELNDWLNSLKGNFTRLKEAKDIAKEYTQRNSDAINRITHILIDSKREPAFTDVTYNFH